MKFIEKSLVKKQEFDDLQFVKQSIKILLDNFNKSVDLNTVNLIKDTYLKLTNVMDSIDYDRYLPLRESVISEICKRMDKKDIKRLVLFTEESFGKKVIISRTKYNNQILVYKDFVKDESLKDFVDSDFHLIVDGSFEDWENLEKPKSVYPNDGYDYLVERIYKNAIDVLRSVDYAIDFIENLENTNVQKYNPLEDKELVYDRCARETPPDCISGHIQEMVWHINDKISDDIGDIFMAFHKNPISLFIGKKNNDLINVCKDKGLIKAFESGENAAKEYLLNSGYKLIKYYVSPVIL